MKGGVGSTSANFHLGALTKSEFVLPNEHDVLEIGVV